MTRTTERKILERLDKIESLLIQVIPLKTELTEEDVLKIIKKGDKEYKTGKTKEFDVLIKEKYPYLLKN